MSRSIEGPHAQQERSNLILIVSEQIVPNLTSVLHYWEKETLAGVHLLYTDDENRSAAPARRIANLLNEIQSLPAFRSQKDISINLANEPVGIQPQSIRKAIESLLRSNMRSRWVLNATGGLKLMAFGVPDLLATFRQGPTLSIIYQELVGGWFEIRRDQDGCTKSIQANENPDTALIDKIPIEILVRTQYRTSENLRFVTSPHPPPLNVLETVREGNDVNWKWNGIKSLPGKSGFAFERFIFNALLQMGIENVEHSLKIEHEGHLHHEMDIVLCNNGKLHYLNLKLKEEEEELSRGVQIREAADTARSIGGLNAEAMLIRPSWLPSEGDQALASAHRVTLLDQSHAERLFSNIANRIGGRLNESLETAEELLVSFKSRWGYALSGSRGKTYLAEKQYDRKSVVSLDDLIVREYLTLSDQNWILLALGLLEILHVKKPQQEIGLSSKHEHRIEDEYASIFRKAKFLKSKTSLSLVWYSLPQEDRSAIHKWMKRFSGKQIAWVSLKEWAGVKTEKQEHDKQGFHKKARHDKKERQRRVRSQASDIHLLQSSPETVPPESVAGVAAIAEESEKTRHGTIKWFNAIRGCAMIHPSDESNDVLVPIEVIRAAKVARLLTGQKIAFEHVVGQEKLCARIVRVYPLSE